MATAQPAPAGPGRGAGTAWEPGPARPRLEAGEVHVWRARLGVGGDAPAGLEGLLSPAERARAATFRSRQHRELYAARHGVRRILLARYLGCAPTVLTFRDLGHGKPALGGPHGSSGLHFNGTSSGDLALLAVAQRAPVGADIERIQPFADWDLVASRVCSPAELEELRSSPGHERGAAFFRCWARKEALAKATGHGLSLPLGAIDVSLAGGETTRSIDVPSMSPGAGPYVLQQLEPGHGFAAAFAVRGHLRRLRLFDV